MTVFWYRVINIKQPLMVYHNRIPGHCQAQNTKNFLPNQCQSDHCQAQSTKNSLPNQYQSAHCLVLQDNVFLTDILIIESHCQVQKDKHFQTDIQIMECQYLVLIDKNCLVKGETTLCLMFCQSLITVIICFKQIYSFSNNLF